MHVPKPVADAAMPTLAAEMPHWIPIPAAAAISASCDKAKLVDACRSKPGSLEIQTRMDTDVEFCKKVFEDLKGNYLMMAKDRFGNYVVQKLIHVSERFRMGYMVDFIISELQGHCLKLAKNHFASRVLEALLKFPNARALIISEFSNANKGSDILIDRNANYVLQKAFSYADRNQLPYLLSTWQPRLSIIKNETVLAKWREIFAESVQKLS
jgi:hypothetical protein